jgi:DNA repair protein REV1
MPSQQDEPPASDPLPSSYPISSPSFWNEAAQSAIPPPSKKRSRSPSPVKDEPIIELPSPSSPLKKARFEADTSLSYLPNRLDPILDDAHAYLANPEYAPNRFGDIGDYMRKKEIKVQTQNRDIALASALEGIPQIFAGLSFYINGNTHPPMEELRKMILQRGGEVRPVLRNKGMVKFIIAPMLTQSKFRQFERYKVVREGWVLESCREGRLLDWSRWKLQPIGGWEEESRKGLEGFLGGAPTQTLVAAKGEDEPVEMARPPSPIALGISTQSLLRPIEATRRAPSGGRQTSRAGPAASGLVENPERRDDTDTPARPLSPIALGTSTRSLLRPATTSIPISPGRMPAETPMKEKIPDNVQRPEGGWWEHYYSTEPNRDAPRLLRDQEWRLKNTAERGNEGGFIDGYYQNSR